MRPIALLLLFTPLLVSQTLPTTNIPLTYFGTHLHTPGSSGWPTVAVGALGHSTEVGWVYVEPSAPVSGVHTYNWSNIDYWVTLAAANGAMYTWTNAGIPSWAVASSETSSCTLTPVGGVTDSECTGDVSSSHYADWQAFVTALVQRYKGRIAMYELWNEPYNSSEYTGTVANMVTLTNYLHDAVRANDPSALLGSQTIFGYNTGWPNSFYAAGGTTDVDVVTTHGEPGSIHPESILGSLSSGVTSVMSANGISGKPIWDTEAEPGISVSNVAAYAAVFYLLHWQVGITRLYWYGWDYGDNNAELKGTPAATAYQQVYDWMIGTTAGACTQSPGGSSNIYTATYTCPLNRGVLSYLASWNAGGTGSLSVSSNYIAYSDLAGVIHPISAGIVPLTNSPMLIQPVNAIASFDGQVF
jgi:hypothetical protein